MSVNEILAELPKLDAAELQLVFQRTLELHESGMFTASPELLRAIEEAERESDEHDIPIEEAYRVVESWDSTDGKAPIPSS
jgi:hypothetical protein